MHAKSHTRVIHIITSLGQGGAEAVLYRLVKQLSSFSLVICLGNEEVYSKLLRESGAEVISLQMPSGKITVKGVWKLFNILNKEKTYAVQTWMYHANLLGGVVARLVGIKGIVWGIHHSNLDCVKTKITTRIVAWLCIKLSHWVPTKIVSCSQSATKLHQNQGYPKKRFVVIPNGYPINAFTPNFCERNRLRAELNVNNNITVLGMVARYHPQKNHDNLIRALGLLKRQKKDFICFLVGPYINSQNTALMGIIREESVEDKIRLLGPRDDIPSIMNVLDMHVLCSNSGEAFPNVLAEAMACGTPCITTDVGDAALIVGDTGWVVPPGNAQDLAVRIAEALKTKVADAAAWQNRKNACRQRIVENFSLERMVASYQQVWSEVASKNRNRSQFDE